MPPINKDHAKAIAKKLGAVIDKKSKAHDIARVYFDGTLVAAFGIRRGSNRNQGHGHIPGDLHISPRKTIELAICTMTASQWVESMRDLGLIDDDLS